MPRACQLIIMVLIFGLRFAVFGLGSSSYPSYCCFAKDVERELNGIGFEQVLPLHTGDATKSQDSAFK